MVTVAIRTSYMGSPTPALNLTLGVKFKAIPILKAIV